MDWGDKLVHLVAWQMRPAFRFFYPLFSNYMDRDTAVVAATAVACILWLALGVGVIILLAAVYFKLLRWFTAKDIVQQYQTYNAQMEKILGLDKDALREWTELPRLRRSWRSRLCAATFHCVKWMLVVTGILGGGFCSLFFQPQTVAAPAKVVFSSAVWSGCILCGLVAVWLLNRLRRLPDRLRKAWFGSPARCRKL